MRNLLNKYKNLPNSVKASLWFVFCSVLQKGIAFITTPIFTRLMSVEQYGQVTIYNSWLEIFTIFSTLNIFYGVYNNSLVKFPEDKERMTSSMLGLCTILTSVFFVIYLLTKEWFNKLTGMSTLMTCILFCEILFLPAFRFWSAKQRFEYKYRLLIFFSLSISFLTAGLGIPCVILVEKKGIAKIITTVVSQVCVALILYIMLFAKGKCFYNNKYWKYALKFNLPLIPHYLSAVILNQSDRVMIDKMVGTAEAGIYGLAYTIGALIIIINEAIMHSYTPFTYQNLKEKKYNKINNSTNYFIVGIAFFVLCLVVIAPELMWILGGDKYSEGVWIIAPIAISIYFRFLYSLYANVEFYFEENYFIMFASVITAIVNIVLNYICIKNFGYLAAGFTTLFCYSFYAFAHYIFSSFVMKKHTGQKLYNNTIILITSILLILLCFLLMLLYKFVIVRYVLFAILFLSIILFSKKIANMINIIRGKEDEKIN